ncbi:hypothetical protein CANCADRAFT_74349 [Tortispora caseinolytica NRRL Y-17796]|uniref:threonine synthase n=1 Tax=Tortispora caseinolytica NRRL Y-17796 TaxID=767744 RepID=A0A1E4TIV0_9ASCO|nr:hypothetical protein CANCADRAFT_74349 [Tortispora caseinolytica NRRL Y-17796]
MSQKYLSTRSSDKLISFEEAVMTGLAPDGGLYIPSAFASLPDLASWKDYSFQQVAFEILSLYISRDEISADDLKKLVDASYSTFRDPHVTPVKPLDRDRDLYLLELFHGPTYAFKDVALQFVGNLFEYFLTRRNQGKAEDDKSREHITVVGATSGDTGSAAIYGLRNKNDVSVFILHPLGRISPIQEAQMTSVLDPNVHNLAVSGTFDDCQDIVKELFGDKQFNDRYHLGAVNSINWARILAQISYYVYSYIQLGVPKVRYVVPTGNFGDILAGYYAKRMGLPVESLVVATNENDILDRFWKTGRYEKQKSADGSIAPVAETYSPAMDILVSSNFERLLWYLARENHCASNEETGELVRSWMMDVKTKGAFEAPESVYKAAQEDFSSDRVSNETTIATIRNVYEKYDGYVLDPHSAVSVTAGMSLPPGITTVCLCTAHPAKFAEAVDLALKDVKGYDFEKVLPEDFKKLATKEKRVIKVPAAKSELVKEIIVKELAKEGLSL